MTLVTRIYLSFMSHLLVDSQLVLVSTLIDTLVTVKPNDFMLGGHMFIQLPQSSRVEMTLVTSIYLSFMSILLVDF